MLSLKLPSYLKDYIDKYRSVKCRAWYILGCVRYVYEHNIDIYAYYEGMKDGKEFKGDDKKRQGTCQCRV